MGKKCVYCKCEIHDDRQLDVCNRCGLEVWGDKMFSAIIQNMGEAGKKHNLPFQ